MFTFWFNIEDRSELMTQNSKVQQEIDELTQELSLLTLHFNTATTRIQNQIAKLQATNNNIFSVGDLVEITNSYKNNQGVQGIVTKVTAKQVTLKEKRGSKFAYHIRAFKNVKRV